MSKADKQRLYNVGDEPVPGYRLIAFLGRGGFGEVWKATAPGGTQVAIKINSLQMRGALKEFRSLMLVKKIQYPNLVPIQAIWLKNEQGEILAESVFDQVDGEGATATGTVTTETMEFVPRPEPAQLVIAMGLGRKSLADRLEECRKQGQQGIPVEELIKYMQDSARAIDYLNSPIHEGDDGLRAIQHCDIKPPNILIVGDAAQVCDFGLARQTNDLRETSLALSPVYAPPELIKTNSPSRSTDQYSLAISYLELRTGLLPFPPHATQHSVIQAHLSGDIDVSKLPVAERRVIKRAIALDPEDRFPSVTEMVTELRAAAGLTPVVEKRSLWSWWTAAAAVLALVGTLVAVQFMGVGTRDVALPAGFVPASTAQNVVIHHHAYPDQLVCERDGLQIPFRLINGRETGPFYMMENKVTNGIFAKFAASNPQAVDGSSWARGACGEQKDLGVDGRDQYPVFRVTCIEAAQCARWLGGELPSAQQWDEAAGRFAVQEGQPRADDAGPFIPLDADAPTNEQVAVNRGGEGPLPAGAATHDISSPYGIRDMAGNGSEWTRSPRDAAEKFDPDVPDELLAMILRGRSYLHPDALHYQDLDDQLQSEARRATESDCDIGFRVVVKATEQP